MSRIFLAKACLGGGGVAIAIAGMALDRQWMVWIAIVLLSVAFLLRFREPRQP